MFKRLGAFRRILYFRVQTGTKPNLFNGGLVIYVYGLGTFSRILFFRVQTGTKPNLSYRGFSCLCLRGLVLLAASCTSVYKQAPKQTYLRVFSRLCLWVRCFSSHLVLPCTNRHQTKPI